MPGMPYTAAMPAIAMTAVQDLYRVTPATNKPVLIKRVVFEQSSDTDSEQLRIKFSAFTAAASGGSGGGTITPKSPVRGAPAAGATVRRNDTTQTSGGTETVYQERGFNVLSGLDEKFDPPIEILPGDHFVVGFPVAPVDSITGVGFIEFDELQ